MERGRFKIRSKATINYSTFIRNFRFELINTILIGLKRRDR